MPEGTGAGGAAGTAAAATTDAERDRLKRHNVRLLRELKELKDGKAGKPNGGQSGDGGAALAALQGRYDRLQEKYDELEDRVPPEGAVVLTGDEAKHWTGFKAFNLAPDEVKKRLDAGAEAVSKVEVYDRRKALAEAAGHARMNPEVFTRLAEQDGLVVAEVKEEDVEIQGKKEKAKVPYLKKATEKDAKPIKASEYANENWKLFEKALNDSAAASGSSSGGSAGMKSATKTGPTFPTQSSGQKPATGDDKNAVDQLIANKRKSGAYAF